VTPRFAQIALCTTDVPRSVQLYTEVFGFADAGGRALWGERIARMQGLGDDTAFVFWWLVGRQDLMQLELFHHTTPPQRAVADRAPNDHGWSRFGIAVPDFDPVLERLAALGIELLSEPLAHDGLRRACFRDPCCGVLVEILEEGAATPGGIRPRFYDLVPAVVYAAISVPDLAVARRFFVETLGLAEEPNTVLHPPELEALWGLDGATLESFVARGGDVYLEVVCYGEPVGRPHPDDHLLSDRGFMNVALGYREPEAVAETHARVIANGYRDNFRVPKTTGGTYINDDQGNTLELLLVTRELDPVFGFAPQPVFRRALARPQPAVGPAGSGRGT
jgi:catechol 2,3-dioxygenase-like lactoylglutathione lyase family enzyme